jgi:hypothetical protein
MAFTLSDLLQGGYRDLGDAIITKATGGSVTTAILGNLLNDLTDDDILLNGALFVVRALLSFVSRHTYRVFAVYRIVLGAVVGAWLFLGR